MKSPLDNFLRFFFKQLKKVLLSSKTLSNVISDVYNSGDFNNIYEHEKMLSDRNRVDTYKKAIAKCITPDDTIADLGTGSGILSFFCAHNNAKRIYAIDHADIIEVAQEIATKNGLNKIIFKKINSRAFLPPEKVDVILHEQIGDDLFDENMIENILDLKQRILKPGGRILPGKFELFLEPVCLKPKFRIPFIWENNLHGINFSSLKGNPLIAKFMSDDYRFRYLPPDSVDFFLCEPEPVLSFDLNDDNLQIDYRTKTQSKRVIKEGMMDGVCLYFTIIFDEEISTTTSPLDYNRCVSWGNRFFRTESTHYHFHDSITFNVKMDVPLIANTWELEFQNEDKKYAEQHLPAS